MFRFLCVFIAAALMPVPGLAVTLTGRVIGLHDGGTITVLDGSNARHKVRLAGIAAPNLKQAFGTRSRQNLSGLVLGKDVAIEWDTALTDCMTEAWQRLFPEAAMPGICNAHSGHDWAEAKG